MTAVLGEVFGVLEEVSSLKLELGYEDNWRGFICPSQSSVARMIDGVLFDRGRPLSSQSSVARMTRVILLYRGRPLSLELGCEDDRGPRRSIRCRRYDRLSLAQTLAQTKIIKTKYLIYKYLNKY